MDNFKRKWIYYKKKNVLKAWKKMYSRGSSLRQDWLPAVPMSNEVCRAGTGQACRHVLGLNKEETVSCECLGTEADRSQHHQAVECR